MIEILSTRVPIMFSNLNNLRHYKREVFLWIQNALEVSRIAVRSFRIGTRNRATCFTVPNQILQQTTIHPS